MQILVLGAGAIGTFYGARLASHHDVTLVGRPDHVDRIRCDGVRVTGLDDETVRVRAVPAVDEIAPGTLILLTTKVYDSEAALQGLVDRLEPGACILCLQNGLYSEVIVRDLVGGRCPVLRGITYFGVTFVGPGVVALKGEGFTSIEDGPRSRALAGLFSECRLDGRISPDMRDEMWRKVIVNCVVNPLTAMTGMDVGWVTDDRIDLLKRLVADECVAVAARDGVRITDDVVGQIDETYRPSRNLSSMHQDVLRGRRTEIAYLNGAVVDLGVRYGVACPVNRALTAIVTELERTARSRAARRTAGT